MVQSLFIRRQPRCDDPDVAVAASGALRSARVIAPMQPMIADNTATINQHLKKWSLLGKTDSGSQVDPQRHLQNAFWNLPTSSWPCLLFTRDNLGTNDAVLGLQEREMRTLLQLLLDDDAEVSHVFQEITSLSVPCTTHSSSLPLRSVLDRDEDSTAARMVRSELGTAHSYTIALALLLPSPLLFPPYRISQRTKN